jgi:chemotaxis signal transduction protein
VEYLPFRIAGRDFVIDASRVRAIIPFEGTPDRHAVPVIDLRTRLGLPEVVYGRRPFLIVLESAGFVADYVSDLIQGSAEQCRGGKLRGRGRPKWVLDADSLSINRASILSTARKPEPGSRPEAELSHS